MKAINNIVFILALLQFSWGWAQVDIKKSSISTAGGSHTNGTTTMVSAIGEVAVQEKNQGDLHLSEGFIGPDILSALGVETYSELHGVGIYPNPVETFLNIELPVNVDYEIYLYDLTGKQLIITGISGENHKQLDLSNLKAALYILIVVDRRNQKWKIMKIQKN